MELVSIYEEVKNETDFWEIWIFDSEILETFEWLIKNQLTLWMTLNFRKLSI